ncbi:MAG: hypothetical protein R3320_09835 [Nitriliruptorales bacterium]|nr:hypothetical protein [Nitriliruptorales bacterium]
MAIGDALTAVSGALRVSEAVGGPSVDSHLCDLRRYMLRGRRDAWRHGRRDEIELVIAAVRAQFDGTEAAIPLGDERRTRRLLADLRDLERALRHATPRVMAA